MTVGEVRAFKIDREIKPDCGLTVNEIKIKKQNALSDRDGYHFNMVGHESEVSIDCEPGFVSHLEAKGRAEGCGIGKMLMNLCFNENKIHNVANKEENKAIAMLDELKDEMDRWCKLNPTLCNEEQAGKVQKWANNQCSKLLYLGMSSKPKSKAHVYFNSAIASGFDYMFIDLNNEMFYPKTGPCSVKTLKERYNDDGDMVDGDDRVKAHGQIWFFCQPKTPPAPSKSKCIIL